MTLRRILIAEDDKSVALTMQGILESLPNCEFAIADDGERALQLFEQQPFDLLITDYKMSGMDGIELATRVRQLCPQVVILMITAYGDDALREQAARVPVWRVLDKPIRLTELRNAVLEALEQPQS